MTEPRPASRIQREMDIFDGRLAGYQITLPGVMVGGDVSVSYNFTDHHWLIEQYDQTAAGSGINSPAKCWTATGSSAAEAYLNLIAVRLGHADPGPVIRAALAWYADRTHGDGLATENALEAAENALEAAVATYKETDGA